MRDHVLISGSVNSMAAAVVVARNARFDHRQPPHLIFADTGIEHPGTYRLVAQTAAACEAICSDNEAEVYTALLRQFRSAFLQLTADAKAIPAALALRDLSQAYRHFKSLSYLRSARTPYDFAPQILANRHIPASLPCCYHLKWVPILARLDELADAKSDSVHVGITHAERCRFYDAGTGPGMQSIFAGLDWRLEAPLIGPPAVTRDDISDFLLPFRVTSHPLDLVEMDHSNCGGFCFRNGKRQWHRFFHENPVGFYYAQEALGGAPIYPGSRRMPLAQVAAMASERGFSMPREPFGCLTACRGHMKE